MGSSQMVYCLEHRGYIEHKCTKPNKQDAKVVICPLCAQGVRIIPDQDPNITWDNHVNTECDPSNYEKVTKKRKCPAPGCKEVLVFSNTIKCRDCLEDHCLKHRFGQDHKCSGPKKLDISFSFMGLLNRSTRNEEPKGNSLAPTASSRWTLSFLNVASNIRASAEAGMAKLSDEINQAWHAARDGVGQSISGCGNKNDQVEQCPQCAAKFSSKTGLVDHVLKVHDGKNGNLVKKINACPKCSVGFLDPVSLVEHVEREHGGSS
ncbi:hypothetical protein Fmac_029736 [Flemingia macrophylla]|uniref:Zinc finger AN1 and C2H2 domain-containing stress-associated protein 16 n=1 Tax=Flemingia macrophylla TaxID=520843 RepID=A0ABD1LB75_9FABA